MYQVWLELGPNMVASIGDTFKNVDEAVAFAKSEADINGLVARVCKHGSAFDVVGTYTPDIRARVLRQMGEVIINGHFAYFEQKLLN